MLTKEITDTPRMRTIYTHAVIQRKGRFGLVYTYEAESLSYIPFVGGVLSHTLGYYAEVDPDSGRWIMTDSDGKLRREFKKRSVMTEYVKKMFTFA